MDPMEQFRLDHRQFMTRLQEAHEERLSAMARLCPGAIEELRNRLQAELHEQGQRYALDGLLIENSRAPIDAIWADYQHHLKHRSEAPRSARVPVQQRSKTKWQRIMDAAVSRLKVAHVVNTTDICEDLNLSIGTLYSYFASQDGLIDQAYDALFEQLLGDDYNE